MSELAKETRFHDRSKWLPGPWDDEADDREDFRHAGFACLLLRGPAGAWCGYVGVPPGHVAHGADYSSELLEAVSVHGGLTYAEPGQENGRICHVPAPGEPDAVWWLGFDCSHAGDVRPKDHSFDVANGYGSMLGRPTGWGGVHEYRTQEYARRQTQRLAEQLAEIGR